MPFDKPYIYVTETLKCICINIYVPIISFFICLLLAITREGLRLVENGYVVVLNMKPNIFEIQL